MRERGGADATRVFAAGYDGSDAARSGLVRAAQLAGPGGRVAVVVAAPLLFRVGNGEPAGEQAPAPDELAAEAVELLGRLGVDAESVVSPLEPADALLEAARDLRAELLVVGTRGRGRAARAVLGSVSTAALHHSPCDVLVVRPGPDLADREAPPDWPQSVLVAYDASPWAERALERATELVRPGGAICLAHATPPRARRARAAVARAALQKARDRLAASELSVDVLELEGDPASAIAEAARTCGADLLVVGSRSRGPAMRLILGSVSTAIVHRAEQDVLVVRRARSARLGPSREG